LAPPDPTTRVKMVHLGGVSTSVGHQELSRRAIVAVQRAVVVMTHVDVTFVDNLQPATCSLADLLTIHGRRPSNYHPAKYGLLGRWLAATIDPIKLPSRKLQFVQPFVRTDSIVTTFISWKFFAPITKMAHALSCHISSSPPPVCITTLLHPYAPRPFHGQNPHLVRNFRSSQRTPCPGTVSVGWCATCGRERLCNWCRGKTGWHVYTSTFTSGGPHGPAEFNV
jgi:hypothetical protein